MGTTTRKAISIVERAIRDAIARSLAKPIPVSQLRLILEVLQTADFWTPETEEEAAIAPPPTLATVTPIRTPGKTLRQKRTPARPSRGPRRTER